jgi:hypothetical protein
MAMDKSAMAALIKANLAAITDADPVYLRTDVLEAFCKGIIDHIKAAMVITTSDAQGGSNTSTDVE